MFVYLCNICEGLELIHFSNHYTSGGKLIWASLELIYVHCTVDLQSNARKEIHQRFSTVLFLLLHFWALSDASAFHDSSRCA